jgi:hypothetical protein
MPRYGNSVLIKVVSKWDIQRLLAAYALFAMSIASEPLNVHQQELLLVDSECPANAKAAAIRNPPIKRYFPRSQPGETADRQDDNTLTIYSPSLTNCSTQSVTSLESQASFSQGSVMAGRGNPQSVKPQDLHMPPEATQP